jgi:hypothetical protein
MKQSVNCVINANIVQGLLKMPDAFEMVLTCRIEAGNIAARR